MVAGDKTPCHLNVTSYLESVRLELASSNPECFREFTKYLRFWIMKKSSHHRQSSQEKYIIRMVSALKLYPTLLHGLNQVISPYYRLQFPHIIDPTSPYYILASNRSAELRSHQDETTIFMTDSLLREAMETGTSQQVLFDNTSPGYQACLAELLQVILDNASVNSLSRKKAYKGLLAFSRNSIIPPSIFVDGLLEANEHPETGGGFADIYKGTWNGQRICCRVLRLFEETDRVALYRDFCQEIIMWRQLCHPNILPFMGASLDFFSPRYTFIAPWFPNGNLKTFLRDHPHFDRFVAIYDIVEGLSYLHNQTPPVYHRDIKAANVLVSNEGVCILADFGLTSIVESQLIQGSLTEIAGSTPWTAPEILDPKPGRNDYRQADIYSLACIMYEVITGMTPWSEKKRFSVQITNLVTRGERPIIPERFQETPEQQYICWLINLCWEPVPERRPKIGLVKNALLDFRKPPGRPLPSISINNRNLLPSTAADASNVDEIRTWLDRHQPYDTKNAERRAPPDSPATAVIHLVQQHVRRRTSSQLSLSRTVHGRSVPNIQRLHTPITPSTCPEFLPVVDSPRQENDRRNPHSRWGSDLLAPRPQAGPSISSPLPRVARLPTPSGTPPPRPPRPPLTQVIRTPKHLNRVPSPLQTGRRTPKEGRFKEHPLAIESMFLQNSPISSD